MAAIPKFDDNALEGVCRIIGDTETSLTGSEIDRALYLAGIKNVAAGTTKWRRIFYALHEKQNRDGCSNNVIAFIERVMDPVNYARTNRMRTKTVINGMNSYLNGTHRVGWGCKPASGV